MANSQIRHEISIIDAIVTAAGDDSAQVTLNTNNYNGTCTFYFEVVATVASGTLTVALERIGTATQDATVTVTQTSFTRVRSASFVPPSGSTSYNINLSGGTTPQVKAARIIIIQNNTPITNCETQIEIGNNETGITATTATALTNPKYWFYDATKWDGTLTVTANVTYLTSSTKGAATITVQEDDGNFNLWHDVVTIVNAGTATTATLVTSSSFTPISGRNYRLSILTSSTKGAISIFNGKIIIFQQEGGTLFDNPATFIGASIKGTGGPNEERAQSFKLSNVSSSITGIKLWLHTVGSPTDILNIKLTSSIGGSTLASTTIDSSTITNTSVIYTLTFSSSFLATANNTYNIELSRSGARDTSNYFGVVASSLSLYSNGGLLSKDNGVWGSASSTDDFQFQLTGITGITKLETQYLFNNTSTTTTGANNFLQFYDPTDWANVNNTYIWSHDGTNLATTSKLQTGSIDIINARTMSRNYQAASGVDLGIVKSFAVNIDGTSGTSGWAQSFTALSGWNLIGVKYIISYSATPVSGGCYVQFISGDNPSGVIVRTSHVLTGSGIVQGSSASGYNFFFDSGIYLASGTSGVFVLYRTLSGSAMLQVTTSQQSDPDYISGRAWKKSNGVWLDQSDPSLGIIRPDTVLYPLLAITMPTTSGNLDLNLVIS